MFDMVLDIRLDFLSFFCCGSQRDTRDFSIYAKLIIVLTPNLELSPYSNVIHGNTTFKLTKSSQRLKKNDNHSVWCFWSFFHFIFVPDNKCHKQKWCVLFFFTRIKLVVRVMARIKWNRLHLLLLGYLSLKYLYILLPFFLLSFGENKLV